MAVLRFPSVVLALVGWLISCPAQTGCKPNSAADYFAGSVRSHREDKPHISPILYCNTGCSGKNHDDTDPAELHLTGGPGNPFAAEGPNLSLEQWHQDLAFLARELPKRHANAFHFVSRERFEAEVDELNGKLDRLNSDEIYVGMDRIANLIGDGHTYIRVPADNAKFPIDLLRFGEEYRVVATTSRYEKALGARLSKIRDTPIAGARDTILALTPSDETQVLRDSRVTGFLTLGIILHGTGIIPGRNVARYGFAEDDGGKFTIDIDSVVPGESSKLSWVSVPREPPLFRQRPDDNFWYTYLSDSHTVYCSFRGYKDLGKQSKGLFALIKQQHPGKVVIDMRLNSGGDYNLGLKYLVHPLRKLPDINRKGHLFVLIDPNTFSAAMSNSAHFRYQTNAILVGQQIGEKPNSYQEAREMKLPNSHWTVRYSVKFYRFVETGENVIRPDQEIIPSWEDYRSGRDPVLQWVLNYNAGSGTTTHFVRDSARAPTRRVAKADAKQPAARKIG